MKTLAFLLTATAAGAPLAIAAGGDDEKNCDQKAKQACEAKATEAAEEAEWLAELASVLAADEAEAQSCESKNASEAKAAQESCETKAKASAARAQADCAKAKAQEALNQADVARANAREQATFAALTAQSQGDRQALEAKLRALEAELERLTAQLHHEEHGEEHEHEDGHALFGDSNFHFGNLSELKELENLSFDFEDLADLKELENLSFDFEDLADLKELENLNFSFENLADLEDLADLEGLKVLEKINLKGLEGIAGICEDGGTWKVYTGDGEDSPFTAWVGAQGDKKAKAYQLKLGDNGQNVFFAGASDCDEGESSCESNSQCETTQTFTVGETDCQVNVKVGPGKSGITVIRGDTGECIQQIDCDASGVISITGDDGQVEVRTLGNGQIAVAPTITTRSMRLPKAPRAPRAPHAPHQTGRVAVPAAPAAPAVPFRFKSDDGQHDVYFERTNSTSGGNTEELTELLREMRGEMRELRSEMQKLRKEVARLRKSDR